MTQAAPPTFPPAGARLTQPVPGEPDLAEATPSGPPVGSWPAPDLAGQPGQPGPRPTHRPSGGALPDLSRPANPPRTAGPRPASASWAQAASQRAGQARPGAPRPAAPGPASAAAAHPPLRATAPAPTSSAPQYSPLPTFEPSPSTPPQFTPAATAPPAFTQAPPAPPAPPTGQHQTVAEGGQPSYPVPSPAATLSTNPDLPAPLFPPPSELPAPKVVPYELNEPAPPQQWPATPAPTPAAPDYADSPQRPPIESELSPRFGDFSRAELSLDSVAPTSAAGLADQNQAGADDWIWSGDPNQTSGSGQGEVAEPAEVDFGQANPGASLFGAADDIFTEVGGNGLVDLALPPAAPPPPDPPVTAGAAEPAWPNDGGGFATPLEQTLESTYDRVTPGFAKPVDNLGVTPALTAATTAPEETAAASSQPRKPRTNRFPDPVIDDPQAGNPWVSGLWIGGAVAAIIGIILLGTVTSQLTNAVGSFFINAGALALVAAASLSTLHWWSRRSPNRRG